MTLCLFMAVKMVKQKNIQLKMIQLLVLIVFSFVGMSFQQSFADEKHHKASKPKSSDNLVKKIYGKEFVDTNVIKMAELTQLATKYLGQAVVTEANVNSVCQNSGCWFETKLPDGGAVRVTFKDYSFTIPKDSKGKNVRMAGTLVEKTMSVKEQKHYLKDAKATKKKIEQIKEPKKVYEFVATGVRFLS